mmetsp:Transcript_44251/g.87310  ORF Transcript_44251/g.87310 Transcript_44251/m.87310 type:complete len:151 (+) Transcript_44251:1069-1521(+)
MHLFLSRRKERRFPSVFLFTALTQQQKTRRTETGALRKADRQTNRDRRKTDRKRARKKNQEPGRQKVRHFVSLGFRFNAISKHNDRSTASFSFLFDFSHAIPFSSSVRMPGRCVHGQRDREGKRQTDRPIDRKQLSTHRGQERENAWMHV